MSLVGILTVLDQSGVAFLISGLTFLGLGILTYSDFFHCEYIQLRNHSEWTAKGGYTVPQFVALLIGTFTLPLGLIFMLIFAVQSFKNFWGFYKKAFVYLLLSTLFAIGTAFSYRVSHEILSCGIFCIGTDATQNEKNDAAVISTGVLYFIVSLAFSFLFFVLSIATLFSSKNPLPRPVIQSHHPNFEDYKSKNQNQLPCPPHFSFSLIFLTFGAFYPIIFFACLSLPTWWSGFDKYDIQSYQASLPNKSYGPYWALSIGGEQTFILKLFPDILIFYGSIYLVSLVAVLSDLYPPLRLRLLSRPAILPFKTTIGEALLVITFFSLLTGQFTYWFFEHGWQQQSRETRSSLEIAARSIGQVSNSVAGLLVLPVSRNSIWSMLFGVSWEYLLVYHRLVGGLFIMLVAAHILLWWGVFLQQNTFPHDLFSIPFLYHSDNFTVPLAFVVSFVVIFGGIGVTSYVSFRRDNYDLFLWVHHLALVVFLVMLWHATMSWYYLTGGLALYALDHVIRLRNSLFTSVHLQDISIKGDGQITYLAYTVSQPPNVWKNIIEILFGRTGSNSNGDGDRDGDHSNLDSDQTQSQSSNPSKPSPPRSLNLNPFTREPYGPLPHQMGQYVFINIPLISQLAWHPFTISSAPGESMTTHYIKAQFRKSQSHLEPSSPLSSNQSSSSKTKTNDDTQANGPYQSSQQGPADGPQATENKTGGVSWIGFLLGYSDSMTKSPDDEDEGEDPLVPGDTTSSEPHHSPFGYSSSSSFSSESNEQWTCKLLSLAASLSSLPKSQLGSIVINVDGPYGSPLQTSRYRNILMIAGGIGITPHFSCYKHIFLSSFGEDRWKYSHIKKVKLVWVVRSYNEAIVFEETLRDLHLQLSSKHGATPTGPQFSYSVYVTQPSAPSPDAKSDPQETYTDPALTMESRIKRMIFGSHQSVKREEISLKTSPYQVPSNTSKSRRPDLQAEIRPLSPWGMEALVYVCGPASMIDEANEYAKKFNVDFKQEIFEL